MCERERSGAQTVKHTQDGQARPDRMTRFDGDQAGDSSIGMGTRNFCKKVFQVPWELNSILIWLSILLLE